MANRKRTSTITTLPAPTGGWNTRDPLPSMKPEDAIVLDNMVPGVGKVSMRRGYEEHATGLGSYVESLMVYSGVDGAEKMFGATPTEVYEVTLAAAVGSADLTGKSNGRWQHTMFSTAAGKFLIMFNGADAGAVYNGSSWSAASITGVADTDIIGVTAHVGRLWLTQKNTLSAWYLGVSAIAGSATEFPIGQFCKLGGYLLAVGSWTRDGGAGMDDNIVFVTSNGEVVIYQGVDPSSSTTWGLVGVFKIATPVGRRCLVKAGGDLAVVTSAGVLPLSQVLGINVSAQANAGFTNKIAPSFAAAFQTSGSVHGWEIIEYPRANLIMCNIPIAERVEQHQYIANTLTGSWARWRNMNAGCWASMGSNLYFGGNDGSVYKFDTGHADNGSSISFIVQQAYSNFGAPSSKRFIAARPLVLAPATYSASMQMLVDYDTSLVSIAGGVTVSAQSMWDVALWDVDDWDASSTPVGVWQSINGLGQVGSLSIKDTLGQEFVLNHTDVLFETGNYL